MQGANMKTSSNRLFGEEYRSHSSSLCSLLHYPVASL